MACLLSLALIGAACGSPGDPEQAQEGTATGGNDAETREELLSLDLGASTTSAVYTPLYVADELGIFEDNGLDVELTSFRGGDESLRAVLGGTVDVMAGATGSIATARGQGQLVKAFYSFSQTPVYELWAAPEVEGMEDLEGKALAVSSIGGSSYLTAEYMIEGAGIPIGDVEIVAAGGPSERMAALSSGQVDVANLTSPTSAIAEREGFNKIADLGEFISGGWEHQALYATEGFLEDNGEAIQRLIAAVQEAIAFAEENQEETIEIIVERVGHTPEDSESALATYSGNWPMDGVPSKAGLELLLQFHEAGLDEDAEVEEVTIDELYDYSFLDASGPGE